MTLIRTLILSSVALACVLPAAFAQGDVIAYVGTYTRGGSKGIYAYRFDAKTGKTTSIGLVGETSNPSFLAIHPNHRFLYAVNENNQGNVTSFSIDAKTGKLTQLNQVSAKGSGPCHLALDKTGKWLFVANYNNGSVAAYPVGDDGKLGEASATDQHAGKSVNAQRQSGPHAHSTVISPDNKFVLVADLGLDQIFTYKIDATKGMTPADPASSKIKPGTGPRHIAFHPNGKWAYVDGEMVATVTQFSYDKAKGSLAEMENVSMLPKDFTGEKSAAEIAVHPNGKFLYASNRGHDSIALFMIDGGKGSLTPAGHFPTLGKTPRNFEIDPSGNYLFAANQDAGGISIFKIDQKTGALTATGDKLDVPFPVCVVFLSPR